MKKASFVMIIFAVLFFIGMKFTPDPHHEEHEMHLLEKIRNHQIAVKYDSLEKKVVDTTSFLKIHANLEGVEDFFTEKRMAKITSFPCSNCHNRSLSEMQANRDTALRKSHWNIHLVHADKNAMNCTTCHAEDNMNQLVTLTGKMLPLDESFKQCGQCHSTQLKDWKGGAHGKELSGWKPPRIAKTCVTCHDPHKPAFQSRFPARYNTKQLGE